MVKKIKKSKVPENRDLTPATTKTRSVRRAEKYQEVKGAIINILERYRTADVSNEEIALRIQARITRLGYQLQTRPGWNKENKR